MSTASSTAPEPSRSGLIARGVRSNLSETFHHGGVVAVYDGRVIGSWGDPTHIVFHRSAIKPFQAWVSQTSGADLVPEELAVASASHGGYPVHVSYVSQILRDGGLSEEHLGCPADLPSSASARRRLIARGLGRPRRIFHNCSGKHAGALRACAASGWPTATYRSPDHPYQQRVIDLIGEVTGEDPNPVGVDGCGFPTTRGTVTGLARAFSLLSSEDRFAGVAAAVTRFPSLTGDNLRADGRLAQWWGGPMKCGALGLVGMGRNGLGIAARSTDGSLSIAIVAIMEALDLLGLATPAMMADLEEVRRPTVFGGGEPVGAIVADLAPTV